MQRYKCTLCTHQFQSKRRTHNRDEGLWYDYVWGKQTYAQIGEHVGRSYKWVRRRLDDIVCAVPSLTPCATAIIADTTFWGRIYGVCVFFSMELGRAIWWHEVGGERVVHYRYGRQILEEKGWHITAAVVDGRRGLLNVFNDIPVQMCQFHQVKQVTKYLTRKPKTLAGRELRALALTLSSTDEVTFTNALGAWHEKWGDFIEEKSVATFVTGRKKWYYSHGRVRSAYRSLQSNLLYLFTYQRYPELNIPNTTNALDGSFSALKKKLAAHHGLRRDRRFKVISQLLSKR